MEFARKINVRSASGEYVRSIHAEGAMRMLESFQAVYRGTLGRKVRDIVLVPSTLKPAQQYGSGPTMARPQSGVSKNRQAKGAKNWVVRSDNAATGFSGGEHSILFPLNSHSKH